jgi:hypothetical protein
MQKTKLVSRGAVAAAAVVGVLAGGGVALATTALNTNPAPKLHGVTGILNSNCTQQVASTRYSVAPNGTNNGCLITIPQTAFPHGVPILIGDALAENIAGETTSLTGGNWVINLFLASPTVVDFTVTPTN